MTKTKETGMVYANPLSNLSTTCRRYKIKKRKDNQDRRSSMPVVLERPDAPRFPVIIEESERLRDDVFKDFHSNKLAPLPTSEPLKTNGVLDIFANEGLLRLLLNQMTAQQKEVVPSLLVNPLPTPSPAGLWGFPDPLPQQPWSPSQQSCAPEVLPPSTFSSSSLFSLPPVSLAPQLPVVSLPAARFEKKDFIVKDRLGNGAFGQVFLVEHKPTGLPCALKLMQKEESKRKYQETERVLLTCVNSPFVLKLFGSFQGEEYLYLITEHIDGFSLEEIVKKRKKETQDQLEEIDEEFIAAIFAQIIRGVQQLHLSNVSHRDLKPANILIDRSDRCAKIIDLGYACESKVSYSCPSDDEDEDDWSVDSFCSSSGEQMSSEETELSASSTPEKNLITKQAKHNSRPEANKSAFDKIDIHHSVVGTPLYTPPETLISGKETGYCSQKMDTWALGILLYELLTGHVPFTAVDFASFQKLLRSFQVWVDKTGYVKLQWPETSFPISPVAKSLVEILLDTRVEQRPDLEAIKCHPFFAAIDWSTLDSSALILPPSLDIPKTESKKRPSELEVVVPEKKCPPGFAHLSKTLYPNFDCFDLERFGQEVLQRTQQLVVIQNSTNTSTSTLC